MTAITTFLMFDGKAAEAMRFYVSLFPNSEISSFSPKYTWLSDKYGVSWQLALPAVAR